MKNGKVLKIVTIAYIFCTAFGLVFYMLLPDVLNLFGANISKAFIYYAGLSAYFGDMAVEASRIYLIIGAVMLVIQLALLIFAVIRNRNEIVFAVVLTDMIATSALVLWKEMNPFMIGILNVIYCIWLGLSVFKYKSKKASP